MTKNWVIISAAGTGKRMGTAYPKQYLPIGDKTILDHTLQIFIDNPSIHRIIVSLNSDDTHWSQSQFTNHSKVLTAIGGAERNESVWNALQVIAAQAHADDWILVHDAVRPCLTQKHLQHMLTVLADHPVGGVLGVPVRDTLKRVDMHAQVEATVSREHLWQVQTPQMFRFALLKRALQKVAVDGVAITDDASAIEYVGLQPHMVLGSVMNFKITYPEDLLLAHHILLNKIHESI